MGIIMMFVMMGDTGVPCGRPPSKKASSIAVLNSDAPSGVFTTSLKGNTIENICITKSIVVLPKKLCKSNFANHLLSFCWCRLTASIVLRFVIYANAEV